MPAQRPKFKKSDLETYRIKLNKIRERLAGDVEHLQESTIKKSQRDQTGELSGYSMHIADAGADDFDRTIMINVMGSEQEILYEVDSALDRIDKKTFGICDICTKSIPLKRLDALPYATLCIKCQEIEEKSA